MANSHPLLHLDLCVRRGPTIHPAPQPRWLGRDGNLLLKTWGRVRSGVPQAYSPQRAHQEREHLSHESVHTYRPTYPHPFLSLTHPSSLKTPPFSFSSLNSHFSQLVLHLFVLFICHLSFSLPLDLDFFDHLHLFYCGHKAPSFLFNNLFNY